MRRSMQEFTDPFDDPEIGSPYKGEARYIERSVVDIRQSNPAPKFRAWQDAVVDHRGTSTPSHAVLRIDERGYATVADTALDARAAENLARHFQKNATSARYEVYPMLQCQDMTMSAEKSLAVVGDKFMYRQPCDLMWPHEGEQAPAVLVLEVDRSGFGRVVRAGVDASSLGPLGPRMHVLPARELTVRESSWLGLESQREVERVREAAY